MEKTTFEARGWQSNLKRQWLFNKKAFLHMLFYRILIIFSLITFIVFALSFLFSSLSQYINYLIIIVWILFIPQLLSFLEGLAMVGSGGQEYGHLNESYLSLLKKNRLSNYVYGALPMLAFAVWIIGLCTLILVEVI